MPKFKAKIELFIDDVNIETVTLEQVSFSALLKLLKKWIEELGPY